MIAPFEKTPLINIDRYNSDNTDYAVRISYKFNESAYPLSDDAYFVFTFQAQHTFSNAVKVRRKIYKDGSIEEGIFETGKSTLILLK